MCFQCGPLVRLNPQPRLPAHLQLTFRNFFILEYAPTLIIWLVALIDEQIYKNVANRPPEVF